MDTIQSNPTPHLHSRAWYSKSVPEFVGTMPELVFAELANSRDFDLTAAQKEAWQQEIAILQKALIGIDGWICFEFTVPRLGRRIDVVLVTRSMVFAIEFKVGEKEFSRAAFEQVWDYALDLKNFHEASHGMPVVPILVATAARVAGEIALTASVDRVYRPIQISATDFRRTIEMCLREASGSVQVDVRAWLAAPYRPTPTIVEAARALYANHSVEAIGRYDAGAQNLAITSRRVEQLIDAARESRKKLICFVTGVPGAGKTLVGLNIATQRRDPHDLTHAVFLSGNGPLVSVLREALTRDEVLRAKRNGTRLRKGEARVKVEAFIQNVHHFRDEALRHTDAPNEHVVIFDEAQRAWNLQQTANFMRRKRGHTSFEQSEAEFLIRYMDRHRDWAVVICLVGGGQEINTGEAGISAWLTAVREHFSDWELHISEHLHDSEYNTGGLLNELKDDPRVHFEGELHLSVSMRSFRAEHVSSFVKSLLDCDLQAASRHFRAIRDRFPVVLTRDVGIAKRWLRNMARGSERFGLVASSKAMRLKPHAIDIRTNIDPVLWFLNGRDDTRSSYYLEDAATEFQVQGLELDWTCVTWDGDLRFDDGKWGYHDFRGSRWTRVQKSDTRNYMKNAYRVLLTRARQGMVIFIPSGSAEDPTRSSGVYDSTYFYLQRLGIPIITNDDIPCCE